MGLRTRAEVSGGACREAGQGTPPAKPASGLGLGTGSVTHVSSASLVDGLPLRKTSLVRHLWARLTLTYTHATQQDPADTYRLSRVPYRTATERLRKRGRAEVIQSVRSAMWTEAGDQYAVVGRGAGLLTVSLSLISHCPCVSFPLTADAVPVG